MMSFNPSNKRELFAPRNGNFKLQTGLGDRTALIAPRMPAYIHVRDYSMEYTSPKKPQSIPRKPLPNYQKLLGHPQTQSFDSVETIQSQISQQSCFEEKESSRDDGVKRTWRFYGTFACLALLNFICAIVSSRALWASTFPKGLIVACSRDIQFRSMHVSGVIAYKAYLNFRNLSQSSN